jgi:hypothetical protein
MAISVHVDPGFSQLPLYVLSALDFHVLFTIIEPKGIHMVNCCQLDPLLEAVSHQKGVLA